MSKPKSFFTQATSLNAWEWNHFRALSKWFVCRIVYLNRWYYFLLLLDLIFEACHLSFLSTSEPSAVRNHTSVCGDTHLVKVTNQSGLLELSGAQWPPSSWLRTQQCLRLSSRDPLWQMRESARRSKVTVPHIQSRQKLVLHERSLRTSTSCPLLVAKACCLDLV